MNAKMNNHYISDEISYLYNATYQCCEERKGYDGIWQIAPFQCSIPYSENSIENLQDLKEYLRESFSELIDFGERRAKKAFLSRSDSITKPSYIHRLEKYIDGDHNQISNMYDIATHESASGGLVFSVFSPRDLIDRKRPGYVPCLISGSFLLHDNELHLNAFFRSQSVVEFGLFDMLFLRKFQKDFLDQYVHASSRSSTTRDGPLNLHFGRVIVHRRFMKSNTSFIRREDIVPAWLREVESFRIRSLS